MSWLLLAILIWLQIKHFIADYMLQPMWIVSAKGDIKKLGGYVHAAIHVIATIPILWLSGLELRWIAAVAGGEFLVHFSIDHLKAVHGRRHPRSMDTRSFWVIHGADQLAHHLTYSAIIMVMVFATD